VPLIIINNIFFLDFIFCLNCLYKNFWLANNFWRKYFYLIVFPTFIPPFLPLFSCSRLFNSKISSFSLPLPKSLLISLSLHPSQIFSFLPLLPSLFTFIWLQIHFSFQSATPLNLLLPFLSPFLNRLKGQWGHKTNNWGCKLIILWLSTIINK